MDPAPDNAADDPAAPWSRQLYRQLHALARARLRDGGRNTLLDTTALVHEAYLRMGKVRAPVAGGLPALAYASRTMRSVIVDMARARQTERRGGEACIVTLTGDGGSRASASADHIVDVHEALLELEQLDARLARVVEMRFFVGMNDAEIGEALGTSERTVQRDWDKARRLLELALRR